MLQKLYKLTFWSGYTAVLVTSVLNLRWRLDEKHVQLLFNLRLDHLLHFGAYFLICMYYLLGQRMGLVLFRQHSMRTFLILTLLLASVTELLQIWVPARAFNLMDWANANDNFDLTINIQCRLVKVFFLSSPLALSARGKTKRT